MEQYDLEGILEDEFGFTSFRPGQKNVIENVLNEVDTLAILPTGSGKSLCYQLPSKIIPGLTIVVSPLISLMIDQVKQVKAKGMKRVAAIHSFLTPDERKQVLRNLSALQLLYISPEMLQMTRMQQLLNNENVGLFVVDEAHCISQWGHEFRTDYLKLNQVLHQLGDPPVLALSATATPEVQEDILGQLERPEAEKLIYPMDKPNIQLSMAKMTNEQEKVEYLENYLTNQQAPTMIYFSSRQMAEKICFELKKKNFGRIAFYHGGMEPVDRQLVQQQFMRNELDIVCCTSAFGMGIDKPDIRLVIHFHLPPRIESFIQEIGRAGRDGRECTSLLLYSTGDERLPRMFIESELPSDEQIEGYMELIDSHGRLPSYEDSTSLELSESQYNFLSILTEPLLRSPSLDKAEAERMLKGKQRKRLQQKLTHLSHMMSVLNTTDCRREMLYSHFQSTIQQVEHKCCDNCDPEVFEVSYRENYRTIDTLSWEERLYTLFHIGDSHEQ
ncbi:RecQ family ATP-dependent DNA helicase [Salimicrobium flavidum]|uniref:ATP-dependent DNA helicase RecQ n=1 Tax=Salimicrobium flavidum TaxID=570947 RepID=A0A1N7IIY9_9BACI|nr:ATP-dependent DNA helicase RecQ [Salimicrobium flavidum]SIS37074.1 ATP-dependent DNA helicase RecQ [Salimicrobium flavidum]